MVVWLASCLLKLGHGRLAVSRQQRRHSIFYWAHRGVLGTPRPTGDTRERDGLYFFVLASAMFVV